MKNRILIVFSLFVIQFVHGQELDGLIKIGLENNPTIQKFELQYQIASEKKKEASTLPNTEFGLGYFVSEPETRTGAQRFKVSVKQMIPWFGSITARENYTNSLAEATYQDIVIAKRKLIASISQVYYDVYTIKAKQRVVLENNNLLKIYEKLALKALEVDKASAVDVLRLQMRENDLTQLHQVLEQNFIAKQTELNLLLNREKATSVSIINLLLIPENELKISFQKLKVHPELIKYDKLYQSVEQSELLNQKEKKPMIGFGLDYVAVSERPNLSFTENGKDILMPMLSVSIPIFNKKYSSKTKQNRLTQQKINVVKQERLNRLETMLEKAKTNRNSAKISNATQLKNMGQAKNAEEILLKKYETGTLDFKVVLEIQELQLKFQMNQIEAVKNYYVQTTIINYLTQQ